MRSRQAILRGELARLGDLPGIGAVTRFDGTNAAGFCSSTLIAADVVLTAAHCLPTAGQRRQLYFTRGLEAPFYDDFDSPLWHRARDWIAHPDYASIGQGRLRHDVALVFLERPITAVEPYALSDEAIAPHLVVGAPATIAGYGRDESGLTGVLHQAKTTLSYVGASELRFGGLAPSPAKCSGDSGGPTFMDVDDGREPRRRVVSVNSYGLTECESASTEMRVDFYLAWITTAMVDACATGERAPDGCAVSTKPRLASAPEAPDAGVADPPSLPTPTDAGTVDLTTRPFDSGCTCLPKREGSSSAGLLVALLAVTCVATRRRR